MDRHVVHSNDAPKALGPYSQAIRTGNFIFCSGQTGVDPATGDLRAGLEAQVQQVLANLEAVLRAAGSSLNAVVKTTVYLQRMDDFAAMNRIYGLAFNQNPPARTTIAAAALPKGALVEMDVIALAVE